jgi:CBS domain-containing protein
MKSVAQVLKSKPGQSVESVAPSTSVFDAVKRMAEKNIGALLVLEEQKIAGIVTELTGDRG